MGNVRFPSKGTIFNNPDANIQIDNTVLEDRMSSRQSAMQLIVRDPVPRARELNTAVKRGLGDAVRSANFDKDKLIITYGVSGTAAGIGLLAKLDIVSTLEVAAFTAPIITAIGYIGLTLTDMRNKEDDVNLFANVRKSLLLGCTPDRYLAAMAVINTHRFIRAAE